MARYELPVPLDLYVYAAGLVVVTSFVVLALVLGDQLGSRPVPCPRWEAPLLTWLGRSPIPRAAGGAAGVLVLLTVISTGLLGSQDPLRNPSEYLTWIYFATGLVLLSAAVGNLWSLVNPWAAVYDVTLGRRGWKPRLVLPERLGRWPAVGLYLAFVAFELVFSAANRPSVVGALALAYSVLTVAGMALFGRDRWLHRGEAFTVLFDLVGRFGPVDAERDERGVQRVWLRPWGVGLLEPTPAGWDLVCFVAVMVGAVVFDSLIATPSWLSFRASIGLWAHPLGLHAQAAARLLGLLLVCGSGLLVFVAVASVMVRFGRRTVDRDETVTAFALTLVPLALAYMAAHNYGQIVVWSQALIPLLVDPFGRGWDVVPLTGYSPSHALAGAAMVWYTQVALVVLGAVAVLALAYLRAGERFQRARWALLSQYPLVALMAVYAMTGLWILAQPVTR